jgi:hypothetical protein
MLDKQKVLETLEGYAIANEFIEQERRERLRTMTPQESWAIFVELFEAGKALIGDETTLMRLENRRIAELVAVRQVFEKLARSQGLI